MGVWTRPQGELGNFWHAKRVRGFPSGVPNKNDKDDKN